MFFFSKPSKLLKACTDVQEYRILLISLIIRPNNNEGLQVVSAIIISLVSDALERNSSCVSKINYAFSGEDVVFVTLTMELSKIIKDSGEEERKIIRTIISALKTNGWEVDSHDFCEKTYKC